MTLLEIATARGCFRNKLNALRAVVTSHDKLRGRESPQNVSLWYKSIRVTKKGLNVDRLEIKRGQSSVKAVAIVESQTFTQNRNAYEKSYQSESGTELGSVMEQNQFSSEDSGEVDDKERLRRVRISEANKGKAPWNKGRKHSPETRQLIRERVKLAMQDPKIKLKLKILGHAQSEETRQRIGAAARIWWVKHRRKLMLQETCYFEWQNLIAEASRKGFLCEEELQWDSYETLDEQLQNEWLESIELRKKMPKPKRSKRGPKPIEQRRKISQAIAAKWADPEYRNRVASGMAKYHRTAEGAERKPRRRPKAETQSRSKSATKEKSTDISSFDEAGEKIAIRLKRSRGSRYKDPLASSKLEMIKNIRAQRSAIETQKIEAIERARVLIAEAGKAADALEVAAMTSPVARASLIETRKLIAEAIQSIESAEDALNISDGSTTNSTHAPTGGLEYLLDEEATARSKLLNGVGTNKVNGYDLPLSEDQEDFDVTKLALENLLNDDGDEEFLSSSSGLYGLPWFDSPSSVKQIGNIKNQLGLHDHDKGSRKSTVADVQPQEEEESSQPTKLTKKWIRGKLVVTEGE